MLDSFICLAFQSNLYPDVFGKSDFMIFFVVCFVSFFNKLATFVTKFQLKLTVGLPTPSRVALGSMGCQAYLPTSLPYKTTIHVGKYTGTSPMVLLGYEVSPLLHMFL